MTKDIIRMAREAGSIDTEDVIETVWAAFTAAERDAIVAIVYDNSDNDGLCCTDDLLAAIANRARTEEEGK